MTHKPKQHFQRKKFSNASTYYNTYIIFKPNKIDILINIATIINGM